MGVNSKIFSYLLNWQILEETLSYYSWTQMVTLLKFVPISLYS